MKIVKFEGATMREALARVKAELGDQAVIVSTRQIRRGLLGTAFEIAAAIEPEDGLGGAAADDPDRGGPPGGPSYSSRRAHAAGAAATGAAADAAERAIAPVKAELRSLRAMVRAGGDTRATAELRDEVAQLRRMIEQLGRAAAATPPAAAPRAAAEPPLAEVAATHPIAALPNAGVVALVGPTGVGKTTTIAKIAARAALVDGRQVAIVTLDNYRVGGVDQIRTFADLIGVPLAVAEHPGEVADHVDHLTAAGADLILIDTAGRSPRDEAAIDDLAVALGRVVGVEIHLAIAAATPAAAIDDLQRRYAPLRPSRLLFTKLDETDAAAELVRAPARLGLPVTWLAVGQAVPEDLEEATAARLLELAERGLEPHVPTHRRAA